MRTTRKQLLGFAGLALVAVMTAVAYAIPAPNAAAEGIDDEAIKFEASADVEVRVLPSPDRASIELSSPSDGMITNDGLINVSVAYGKVKNLAYTLTYKGDSGNITVYSANHTITAESGFDEFSINLKDLAAVPGDSKFGTYELTVAATTADGGTLEDRSTFEFVAIIARLETETAENEDPIISISTNRGVHHMRVQLYNSKHEPMFVGADGTEEPLLIPTSDIDPVSGKVLVTLPFEKYGIEPGEYVAIVTAYSTDGREIGMATVDIAYTETPVDPEKPVDPSKPVEPSKPGEVETPNTGSTFFSDLNISKMDYLMTGLFVFGLVAGAGFYLIHRKTRR